MLILRNLAQYVCKQRRYKEFHIACFYSLALLIICCRIVEHIFVLLMNKNDNMYLNFVYESWVAQYTARQLENILAVQQVCSMIDMQLMVKYQVLTDPKAKNRKTLDI